MKDEEIIKAYERCFTLGFDESTCYECPFYTATAKCTEDLRDSVLNLIMRQKAEINNLKAELSAMRSMVNSLKMYIEKKEAEIKSLKKKNAILIRNADTAFQDGLNENRDLFKKEVEPEIRAEAIKEFAERLKSRLANLSVQTKTRGRKTTPNYVDDIANQILHNVAPQEIDNIVKEMTEGNNDRQS